MNDLRNRPAFGVYYLCAYGIQFVLFWVDFVRVFSIDSISDKLCDVDSFSVLLCLPFYFIFSPSSRYKFRVFKLCSFPSYMILYYFFDRIFLRTFII